MPGTVQCDGNSAVTKPRVPYLLEDAAWWRRQALTIITNKCKIATASARKDEEVWGGERGLRPHFEICMLTDLDLAR